MHVAKQNPESPLYEDLPDIEVTSLKKSRYAQAIEDLDEDEWDEDEAIATADFDMSDFDDD